MKKATLILSFLCVITAYSQSHKSKPNNSEKKEIESKEAEKRPEIDFAPIQDENNEDINLYSASGIDVKPEFIGGTDKLYAFFDKNYHPVVNSGKKFKAAVSVVIEKDGSISSVTVSDAPSLKTSKEIERVFTKMPKWKPGALSDKIVRCSYTIPMNLYE